MTVITICREPPDVVRRFAAWHRHLGADDVCILFDDPDDPMITEMGRFPWLRAVRCDTAFWAGMGLTRDDPFSLRQVAALTHAYRSVTAGWVAVLDADELFHFDGRGFAEVLAGMPDTVRGVRVRTAEYMTAGPDVIDGLLHFRMGMSKSQASSVYREAARYFRPSHGLIGHDVGKSITRAGLRIRRMRPHWAAAGREQDLTDLQLGPEDGAWLLHFITSGYAQWRAKLDRRMAVPGGISVRIKREVERIRTEELDVEAGLRELYTTLYQADPGLVARLDEAGKHLALADTFGSVVEAMRGGLVAER